MRIRVLFATVEGQTEKIAGFAAETATQHGHAADLVNIDGPAPVAVQRTDVTILAAPVHQRRHPRSFEAFVAANTEALNAGRTLLLSVSMSAAFPEGREEAQDYMTEMLMRTGLNPAGHALVAGAIRTSKYDYFAAQVVRHVVMRDRDYDAAATEHEFTDWTALASTIEGFLDAASGAAARQEG